VNKDIKTFKFDRKVVIDTETTGLDVEKERIIEIGAIVIQNNIPTGENFHFYLNPEGVMVQPGAFMVHKISNYFLRDKPRFKTIVDEFFRFIGDSDLIFHNAPFDIKFLRKEILLANRQMFTNNIIDTLQIARNKFPGKRCSLDHLCKRFKIDLDSRSGGHGALIDSIILSKVYFFLINSEQSENSILFINQQKINTIKSDIVIEDLKERSFLHLLSENEKILHLKIREKYKILTH
jgi:DNA polymerase-3 subunit epsilon